MSKYTPGPWLTLCNENRHGEFSFSIEAPEDQPEGTTIARVLVSNDDEANARLIAAAPELLEALTTAAEALRHAGYGFAAINESALSRILRRSMAFSAESAARALLARLDS